MALREDITPLFLENASNLPIYILQGGADDNVPPIQARMFNKILSNLNYKYTYHEIEAKGHWWNFDSTSGVDCVDLRELMDFLRASKRDPYPKNISFKTCDLDQSNQCYWLRIDELERLYYDGIVNAKIEANKIIIQLENIAGFTMLLNENLVSPGLVEILLNNQRFVHQYRHPNEVSFYKKGNRFLMGKKKKGKLHKRVGLYGPIKRAYFEPFMLIYGTTDDSITTEKNLHRARLQSYTWWLRANGFVKVLPDTEITNQIIKNYNLILFGNPKTNEIIKRINNQLPIYISGEDVYLGKEKLQGKDLCLLEIYPNPLNPEKFILLYAPASGRAEDYLGSLSTLYSGAGLPDFIVWDKRVRKFGWAGVIATGFFDQDWQIDKSKRDGG